MPTAEELEQQWEEIVAASLRAQRTAALAEQKGSK
jgi:hypothetical protein